MKIKPSINTFHRKYLEEKRWLRSEPSPMEWEETKKEFRTHIKNSPLLRNMDNKTTKSPQEAAAFQGHRR